MTVNLRVNIWWTESISESTVDRAEDAIENLASQLGTGTNINRMGEYSGNDDHETYSGYMYEFKRVESHYSGFRSLLIYRRSFNTGEGGSDDSHPNLGSSTMGDYRRSGNSYAIVNGNILETPLDNLALLLGLGAGAVGKWFANSQQRAIFENVVQHEVLHGMLDNSNSPAWDDHGHGFGEVNWGWLRDSTSPMLTGYVEPRYSSSAPNEFCNRGSDSATKWNDSLSPCTEVEGDRWLEEEFYNSGDDDGPPPCQPGQPC